MSTHDTVQHRQVHEADPDAVEVRQPDVDESGDLFRIRMPITSTGEARDGEAFDDDRLRGFQDQLQNERIPLFLDHGRGGPGETRYGQLRKVGYWDAPSIEERGGATDLDADAVLVDPDALDDDVGEVREALSWLRAQAEAGLPISASVGWSENVGDRDVPGDADLLEVSIVGIPSDPRTTTTTSDSEVAMARAVKAASSDFDVETFVRELTSAERNTVEVNGEEIDLTPPDAVQSAATVALAKDDELEPDCGTGAGRQSARDIAGDDVSADRIDDIAAYLTSHEEDVTADGPPSDWSDEEWQDCGNLQYALWGGTGTGTGLEWAQSKANEVAEAAGDELPYERNLDDPAFSEGDAVEWSSNDTTVRGRVADVGDEFSPAEGVTITGDEGEAVYLIHELDDSLEPPQYRRENVAKPESSLDESGADLPPLDGNFADSETSMTESDQPDEGTDRDESDDIDPAEFRESMLEMQRTQTETLETLSDAIREGDKDGDDEEEDDDDDMDENAADAEGDDRDTDESPEERTVTLDGEELPVDEASERIAALREEVAALDSDDVEEPQTQDRAEEPDDSDGDTNGGFGMAALEER